MEELRKPGRLQASFLRKRQATAQKRKCTGYRTEVMRSVLENGSKGTLGRCANQPTVGVLEASIEFFA